MLLQGELGAGKTTFVQGVARGLGYDGAVPSKSFVLLGEYAGRVKLYHARTSTVSMTPARWRDLALDDISGSGVLVVEWPERAEDVLLLEHVLVRFEVTSEDGRVIELEANGVRPNEIIARLGED